MEAFVEEALGIDGTRGFAMSSQQREACQAVSKLVTSKIKRMYKTPMTDEEKEYAEKLGISIMAGQGTGKDGWVSWFVIWFNFCFKNVLMPCTAPSADQLKNILWTEVSRWLNRVGDDGKQLVSPLIKDKIIVQNDRIYRKPGKGGDITNFAFPKTANPKDDAEAQAKTLYGFHDIHMAIIADDAAGILDPVFKPLEGTVTKDCNFVILLFNPIFNTGFAIETHTGPFAHKWIGLHWDSEESELVTRQHIQDMEDKYGRESNTFRTLVKGLPPIADNDSIIPYAWAMDATRRDIEPDDYEPLIGGCDPGAGGDNSVLRIRHGLKVEEKRFKFSSPSSIEVGDWAAAIALEEQLDALFFDIIGIGNGAYYEAKKVLAGSKCKVYAVDVRTKANDDDKYGNLRAELMYKMRQLFEDKTIGIPNDANLISELTAAKMKKDKMSRKELVEDKYEIKKRLKLNHSPNDSDALMITFAKNDSIFRKHPVESGVPAGRYAGAYMSQGQRSNRGWLRA
jgi:phage terminase large subunit